MTGDHFAETGKSYAHYANAAKQIKAAGTDAVLEDFLGANLWGDPAMLMKKLEKRREVIGDFELNGVFSYQSTPYDQVEQSMRLFAKEVGSEIKTWQTRANRPAVDVGQTGAIEKSAPDSSLWFIRPGK